MAKTQPQAASAASPSTSPQRGFFPDPSLSLIEFADGLGLLVAERTERDAANRRLVLKKVAYVRIQENGWGASAHAELWIEQDKGGGFRAVEPKSGRVLRHPSRRRYEVAFLPRDIFDCAIQCIKDRQPDPLFDLALVTFGAREGFGVEQGNLLAPDDYADVRQLEPGREWFPTPPPIENKPG
jgi:hypothetical protein